MQNQNFYTSSIVYGNNILYRGVENGQRVSRRVPYQPTLFLKSTEKSKYKTFDNVSVSPMKQSSIKDAKKFIDTYSEVSDFEVYGCTDFQYSYLSDIFKGPVDYDISQIVVANIDIETTSEYGFPEPETAREEITAITIKVDESYFVFGCGEFETQDKNIHYFHCENEIDLIEKFLDRWENIAPDIITGWNVDYFDIPYLIERIKRLKDQASANRLSFWKIIGSRKTNYMGQDREVPVLYGSAILDYLELYRKYQPKQETNKLNYIAYVEVGEKKVDYSKEGNLRNLYRDNFQKFIEYNIHDTTLVSKIDQKVQLINMVIATAYDAKANYIDVFTQVRLWDVIIFNYFRDKNIVIPPRGRNQKEEYSGGYVKDPVPGMYDWVVSYDLNSLYPHLMAQYNISPECLVKGEYNSVVNILEDYHVDCSKILNREYDLSYLKDKDLALALNGHHFRRDIRGFLPDILMRMYGDRVEFKKKSIAASKKLTSVKNKLKDDPNNVALQQEKFILTNEYTKWNNWQVAKKVCINSCYGAVGNNYCRYFDKRLAEAVTVSGQVVIQWIAKYINSYLQKLLSLPNEDFVIAVDTDSNYLCFDKVVRRFFPDKNTDPQKIVDFLDKFSNEKIQPIINKSVQDFADYTNAYQQKMQMKRETIANRAIWAAKKRYVMSAYDIEGARYKEPILKITGMDAIKSSTPEICRESIKEAIKIIMKKTQEDLFDHVEKFREEFSKKSFQEIACPTGVNNLDKYSDPRTIYKKGCPMHVRSALIYNHLIKKNNLQKDYPLIAEGDRIRYIFLLEPNSVMSNVVGFVDSFPKEFNLNSRVDYDAQFDRVFMKPLSLILNAIKWEGQRVSNLSFLF